jgi:ribosomal protein S27AE
MKIPMNKRCPKCGGNIFLEHDGTGWSEHCLQCGYDYDLTGVIESLGRGSFSGADTSATQSVRKTDNPRGVLELLGKYLVPQA